MSATAEKTDGLETLIDLRAEFGSAGIEAFLAALPPIGRVRQRLGFTTETPAPPMSFTGKPGTSKTMAAARMAGIWKALGVAPQGPVIFVTRHG